MMGLTDRLEPWMRMFQPTAAARPGTDSEIDPLTALARTGSRAAGDGDGAPPPRRRTGRFDRRRVLQEQDSG